MATKTPGLAAMAVLIVGVIALSGVMLAVAMLGQKGCGGDGSLQAGPATATARKEIPPKLLPIFQQVGAEQKVYWQILAGVSREECTFGETNDPSCTIRWHGTGLGPGNSAGAAGLMQIGIGGAAGNEWGTYGTDGDHNGHYDPHDPFDGIPSAAKVLRQGKGMPPAPAPLNKIREAVRAYNGTGPTAEAYADRVMADAASYGLKDDARPQVAGATPADVGDCGDQGAGVGPANLKQAVTLKAPREYETLPSWAMVGGRSPEQCDKRIIPDVLWVLRTYHARVTACRETGHHTHGAGLATDLVPEPGHDWPSTIQRLAEDLGWTPGCGGNGLAKHAGGQCDLVPAIHGIFYNGYPGHGDPAHCSGGCGAHIRISWEGSIYAAPELVPRQTPSRCSPCPPPTAPTPPPHPDRPRPSTEAHAAGCGRMTTVFVSAVVAAACTLMAHGALPDSHCTPGSVQSTDAKAICMPGWGSRHRHVTTSTRAKVYTRYGLTGSHPFPEWEVDHRVPLELGGSNAISNLWPEHHPQTKDQLENSLSRLVCRGRISQRFAQRLIATDWLHARQWVNEHFADG